MANRQPNPLSEAEQKFIKKHGANYSIRQLANILEIAYPRVFKFVKANNIPVKNERLKVKSETDFFDYDRMYL